MNQIERCAFTGHHPRSFSFGYNEDSPEFRNLISKIKNCIIQVCNSGCRTFYCGMAEGVDLWCGELIVEMRDRFEPPLEICAVVPFLAQPQGMGRKNQERYRKIMEHAKERYLVSRKFTKSCFHKRNCFLVDSCDAIIAVMDEKSTISGTAHTVRYAKKKKKKIFLIQP